MGNNYSPLEKRVRTFGDKGKPNGVASLGNDGMIKGSEIYKVGDIKVSRREILETTGWAKCDGRTIYEDDEIFGDLYSTIVDIPSFSTIVAKSLGGSYYIKDIVEGNERLVGVGNFSTTGHYYISIDKGETWTRGNVPSGVGELNSVAYGNGRFIAVGAGGSSMVSSDGENWYRGSGLPSNFSFTSVAYGNGRFIAVGAGGKINKGESGYDWTSIKSGIDKNLFCIIYKNNTFVVGGADGTLGYSLDNGDTFNFVNSNIETSAFTSIIFEDGKFIAITGGTDKAVLTSKNGLDWEFKSSYIGNSVSTEHYFGKIGDNYYLLSNGSFRKSRDLITWELMDIPSTINSSSVTAGYTDGKRLMFAGYLNHFIADFCKFLPKVDGQYIKYKEVIS